MSQTKNGDNINIKGKCQGVIYQIPNPILEANTTTGIKIKYDTMNLPLTFIIVLFGTIC